MRLIDLSQPIRHGGPHCPAHPSVRCEVIADHTTGDWHMELLSMASHTGSHVDAPLHRIAGGASISDLPLETWVGRAYLADLRDSDVDRAIGADDLAASLANGDLRDAIVLLATGFDRHRDDPQRWERHPAHLTPSGAAWIVERGCRGIGIDGYSIGGSGETNSETHAILLGNGVWIVEDLAFPPEVFDLSQPVKFWALPINFSGQSGAFCRPVVEVP